MPREVTRSGPRTQTSVTPVLLQTVPALGLAAPVPCRGLPRKRPLLHTGSCLGQSPPRVADLGRRHWVLRDALLRPSPPHCCRRYWTSSHVLGKTSRLRPEPTSDPAQGTGHSRQRHSWHRLPKRRVPHVFAPRSTRTPRTTCLRCVIRLDEKSQEGKIVSYTPRRG